MAGQEVIIDESYIKSLEKRCWISAQNLLDWYGMERKLEEYIAELQKIKELAIKDGEINKALDVFISYAEKMKGYADSIASDVNKLKYDFLDEIDAADEYIF